MNITAAVKRAPRWAIYSAAGIAAGGLGIALWRHRTDSTGNTPLDGAGDPNSVDQFGRPTGTQAISSSPPGVIVPPVILDSGSADQSGTGLGQLQELYMGGVGDMLTLFQSSWSQMQATQDNLLNTSVGQLASIAGRITDLATAGSAPQPAAQAPVNTPTTVPLPSNVSPSFAQALVSGDPNALNFAAGIANHDPNTEAYIAAGAPTISPEFAAWVEAGGSGILSDAQGSGSYAPNGWNTYRS